MTITKKTTAVCAAALAITLPLTACGSGEGESGGLSTAAEAPGAATEAATAAEAASEANEAAGDATDAANKDANDKKDTAATSKANSGAAGGNSGNGNEEVPQIANPFENGMPQNTNQPLEGGKEGSAQDKRQMEETARKVLNPDSFATWTRTILDNSCSAVTEPMMEELDRQGLTLEQVEEAGRIAEQQGQALNIPKTDVSISDVRVEGNRASANLTARSDQGEQTEVMIFEKEDGRWKLCN